VERNVMYFSLEKLNARVPEISGAAVRAVQPIEMVFTCVAPGAVAASAMAPAPPADAPGWAALRPGERWGGAPGADPSAPQEEIGWGIPATGGGTHWLRTSLRIPNGWRGGSVHLALAWEGNAQASLEAIVYLDGHALSGLDEFHRSALLPDSAHGGEHELLIRCYTPYRRPFGGLSLQLRDETIFQLGQVMRAMLEALTTYQDTDIEKHALLARLNAAYAALDLREGWQSERFAESARVALEMLTKDQTPPTKDQPESDSSVLGLSSLVPTIVATGHAHLDVAWLWPLWRTRQKVAHTVANALHLMERYPDYHFSMSQPQVYSYLKRDDPELYERMKRRIAEGRFEPVGMMWLEPDCNVTSGESLVRQLIQGARFFAEEFGEINHVVWLPDVFGYSAALPQIMRLCGISCFMTTKISWNQFNRMPNDTFRWRGIDGSEVLTHFITASAEPLKHPSDAQFYTYVGHMTGQEAFGLWNHYRQKNINDQVLYSYGWGDGGGGPTEEMLEAARVLGRLPGFPGVKPGRVDTFFQRLYEHVWDDPQLPTWVGELYLEYHRGTYTSQARNKRQNREAEQLYREAEWLNAWAVTLGAENRQAQLDAGWRTILLNQFHDILPGSSIPQVYADSNADYAEVCHIADVVRLATLEYILTDDERPKIDNASDQGRSAVSPSSLIVFNSLPWERRDVARLPLDASGEPQPLFDADGNVLPAQVVEERPGERALLVEVVAPSYGYSTLINDQRPMSEEARRFPATVAPSTLVVRRSSLESDDLRLELNEHGEVASLYDKRARREAIARNTTANQLVAYEDRPMQWDAWDIDIFYEEKPYPVREILDWRVTEEGPLRAAIEITRRFGQSTIRQRICVWRNSRRVDFVTDIDWQERQVLLRALFPLNVNANRATCEIQFGAVERPTHRNTSWDVARFEVCAHRWVDLSEGDYGVALLNNGKYGHSLYDNILGLSLLKSAIFPDRNADRGQHRFTYSLLPHQGDWRTAQVVRRAYELNAPLFVTNEQRPRSKAGQSSLVLGPSSFVSTPTDHVVVETVKVADDGNGLIVRLYEAHNQRGAASLRFARPVASAVETDLLERETRAAEVEGDEVRFEVRPFEIKTLRVRLA
jgi:alpha-mannosidase